MAVKYQCPKCGRRFAEWGAEKLEFQCPHDEHCPAGVEDEQIALVRMGSSEDSSSAAPAASKPSLKRRKAAPAAPAPEPEKADTETYEESGTASTTPKAGVDEGTSSADTENSKLDDDDDDGDEEVPEDLDFENGDGQAIGEGFRKLNDENN